MPLLFSLPGHKEGSGTFVGPPAQMTNLPKPWTPAHKMILLIWHHRGLKCDKHSLPILAGAGPLVTSCNVEGVATGRAVIYVCTSYYVAINFAVQPSKKHQESLSSTCFSIQSMGFQQKTCSDRLQVPPDHDADVEDVVVYADGSSVKERRLQVISMPERQLSRPVHSITQQR